MFRSSRLTRRQPRGLRARPALEALEDRCLPSHAIVDLGGVAPSAINNAGVLAGSWNTHAASATRLLSNLTLQYPAEESVRALLERARTLEREQKERGLPGKNAQ